MGKCLNNLNETNIQGKAGCSQVGLINLLWRTQKCAIN